MAISRDLFLSILALDAYNRGYGAGVNGLSEAKYTTLGNAEVDKSSGIEGQAKGFYGIAYTWGTEKVISYRGTDTATPAAAAADVLNGWTAGLGYTGASQLGSYGDTILDCTP